ncbi:MAG: ABC transporter substrate-binding protein [Parcubacteria group bacterium]|jgi:putative ABC transport system substrate-binding protein
MKKTLLFLILLAAIVIISTIIFRNGIKLKGLSDLVSSKSSHSKKYAIGVVLTGGAYQQAFDGLRYQLAKEGYNEGENVSFIIRDVRGDTSKLPEAIQSLLGENPDLIYAISTPVTSEVKKLASSDIPIVFNAVGDPLGAGFIKSYSRTETNLTGCSNLSAELSGKRLEIFKEAFPGIDRVVTFYNPENSFSTLSIQNLRPAAMALGINLREFEVKNTDELRDALAALKTGEYDGIYVVPDAMVVSNIDLVIQKSLELNIPSMAHEQTLMEQGVSLAYGANFYDLGSQCASTVISILSGQKPDNIPVITPSKLDIIVNLKQIKESGREIDSAITTEADKVIF